MSTKRGGDLPRRLERVRKLVGYGGSLRAFWKEVGGEDVVSYESCRNYHGQTENPRDPSAAYLRAVVTRFGVNPMWLLTGEVPELWKDLQRTRPASTSEEGYTSWGPAVGAVPLLADWPLVAKVAFLDTLDSYFLSFAGAIEVMEASLEAGGTPMADVLGALSRELYGMVSVKYSSIRTDLTHREFGQYMVALLHAVQLRIPGVGDGPHIFERFQRLDPEWEPDIRRMMQGKMEPAELDAYIEQARAAPLA
jgi:hypothetical protein